MQTPGWFATGLFAGVAFSSVLSGQASVTSVSGVASCTECVLRVTRVVTLGALRDPELPDVFARAVRDGRGNFLLRSTGRTLLVYDSTGAFMREVGGIGMGPNEFPRGVQHVLSTSDGTVPVVVLSAGVGLELDSTYTELQREQYGAMPPVVDIAWLPGGGPVVLGRIERRDTAGVTLSIFGREGSRSSSWTANAGRTTGCISCYMVGMTPSVDRRSLWTVRWSTFTISRWSLSGRREASITVRASPWFEKWRLLSGGDSPGGSVQLRERADGLLLVVGVGRHGRPVPGSGEAPRGLMAVAVSEERLVDTSIDVFNPATGVLASTTVPNVFLRPIDGRFLYRMIEHPSGAAQYEIWEVSLDMPG